jgi:hypothetical protein
MTQVVGAFAAGELQPTTRPARPTARAAALEYLIDKDAYAER